jgi:hypothetical protein
VHFWIILGFILLAVGGTLIAAFRAPAGQNEPEGYVFLR